VPAEEGRPILRYVLTPFLSLALDLLAASLVASMIRPSAQDASDP
jgi:hypothetical protein